VLCRNLAFTYFQEPLQRAVLAGIIERIRPGGFLVTGKQERLPEPAERLSPFGRHVGTYRVAPA
jgi:chemotaxis protein methyltransferase CheR